MSGGRVIRAMNGVGPGATRGARAEAEARAMRAYRRACPEQRAAQVEEAPAASCQVLPGQATSACTPDAADIGRLRTALDHLPKR